MQNKKKEKNVNWWVANEREREGKFDIESNAINLGFAIRKKLASLYFMCLYAKSATVLTLLWWWVGRYKTLTQIYYTSNTMQAWKLKYYKSLNYNKLKSIQKRKKSLSILSINEN